MTIFKPAMLVDSSIILNLLLDMSQRKHIRVYLRKRNDWIEKLELLELRTESDGTIVIEFQSGVS